MDHLFFCYQNYSDSKLSRNIFRIFYSYSGRDLSKCEVLRAIVFHNMLFYLLHHNRDEHITKHVLLFVDRLIRTIILYSML
jgi:hypothetical protein